MQLKSVAAARSTRAAASPLQQTAETAAGLSSEGFNPQRLLEGEIEAAANHSEIISRPVDDAEAQVIRPPNVPRETNFQTGAELTKHFGFAAEMFGLRIDLEGIRGPLRVKGVPFAAAENRAHTRPCVRRKTCAGNRIAQGKRS